MTSTGLNNLGAITLCTNLYDLNLSGNRLSGTLAPFASLINLESLNLAHNRLTSVQGIGTLVKLQHLNLMSNCVGDIDALSELAQLPGLHTLALAALDGSDSNPVCTVSGYRNAVTVLVPAMRVLDGVRVVPGGDDFYTAAAELDKTVDAVDALKRHEPDPSTVTIHASLDMEGQREGGSRNGIDVNSDGTLKGGTSSVRGDGNLPRAGGSGAAKAAEVSFDTALAESRAAVAAVEEALSRLAMTQDSNVPTTSSEVFITETT